MKNHIMRISRMITLWVAAFAFKAWGMTALLILFAGVSVHCAQDEKAREGAPAQKLALLIGVQEYASPSIRPLSGCVNDVADVEQALTTTFGFETRGIKKLLNKEATHKAIVEAFQRHLIAGATAQTTVLFYFAGHGSQMKNADGTEADGLDETICPHDARQGDVRDISDKEIAGLLDQLMKKTSKVTLIFDSCHSGSATREVGGGIKIPIAVSRFTPPDERPPPALPSYARLGKGILERSTAYEAREAKYTAFFGCLAKQSSHELDFNGVRRGVFTYNLVRQLQARGEQRTLRDILEQTQAGVAVDIGYQQPNAEGNLDIAPFGEATIRQEPYFLIHRDGDKLSLAAGAVHGLTEGSTFEVYPPGTKTFGKAGLGQVMLSKVEPFKAEAEPIRKAMDFPDLARAVERMHSFGKNPFKVCMLLNDHPMRSQVEEALKMTAGIVSTEVPSEASLLIAGGADQDIQLLDPAGVIQFDSIMKVGATSDTIAASLRRWSAWLSAVAINNPGAVFQGKFHVSLARDRGIEGAKGLPSAENTFHHGDSINIEVKNLSGQPVYFYILNFSSDGSIIQIYPKPGTHEQIPAQGQWKTPWPSRLSVPAGRTLVREIMKVVFSQNPVDFSPLLTEKKPPLAPDSFLRAVTPAYKSEPDDWVVEQRIFDVKRN